MALSPMYVTPAYLQARAEGSVNLATDSFYAALLAGAYVPAQAHGSWLDIKASQIGTGGDYTGPIAVANPAIIGTGKTRAWDSDPVNFGTNVSITAKYLAVLKGSAGAPADADLLIGLVDLNWQGAQISAITKANPAQVTATGHGFTTGENALILGSDMREANRVIAAVTVIDADNLTLDGVDLTGADVAGTMGLLINLNDATAAVSSSSNFRIEPAAAGWFVDG